MNSTGKSILRLFIYFLIGGLAFLSINIVKITDTVGETTMIIGVSVIMIMISFWLLKRNNPTSGPTLPGKAATTPVADKNPLALKFGGLIGWLLTIGCIGGLIVALYLLTANDVWPYLNNKYNELSRDWSTLTPSDDTPIPLQQPPAPSSSAPATPPAPAALTPETPEFTGHMREGQIYRVFEIRNGERFTIKSMSNSIFYRIGLEHEFMLIPTSLSGSTWQADNAGTLEVFSRYEGTEVVIEKLR